MVGKAGPTKAKAPVDLRKVTSAAALHAKKSKGAGNLQYALWAGGAMGTVVVGILAMAVSPAPGPFQTPVNDRDLIIHVNRNARTWKAGPSNHFDGWTLGDVKLLQGVGVSPESNWVPPCRALTLGAPESFDARERWPQCFLRPPHRMGNCTASWAIATVSAIANRFCVSSPSEYKDLRLSPQHMLSCDTENRGCMGGDVDTAFAFAEQSGLVSEDCFPYESDRQPSCESICPHETPRKTTSHCVVTDEASIRREIYANGPVVALLMLTDDFLVYKGGLYVESPTATPLMDSRRNRIIHAVKLIGWGTMAQTPYWIIENSFGEDWGEGGYGKVVRGGDPEQKTGILIESYVLADVPRSKKRL